MSEAVKVAPSRAELRAKIFGEKRKSRIVTLDDGLQIEVRQTTVGQMMQTVESEDRRERLVRLMVSSCFVPGTNEPLFEMGDVEVIMEMPSGGYYQKLLDAINEGSFERAIEEAKKTSGGEAPSTTSS